MASPTELRCDGEVVNHMRAAQLMQAIKSGQSPLAREASHQHPGYVAEAKVPDLIGSNLPSQVRE
jgi:hypothetical protein